MAGSWERHGKRYVRAWPSSLNKGVSPNSVGISSRGMSVGLYYLTFSLLKMVYYLTCVVRIPLKEVVMNMPAKLLIEFGSCTAARGALT